MGRKYSSLQMSRKFTSVKCCTVIYDQTQPGDKVKKKVQSQKENIESCKIPRAKNIISRHNDEAFTRTEY